MKNIIMYYYNFNNISIYKLNNKNYIKYQKDVYIFQPIINQDETLEIYHLLKGANNFYKIIINKDQSIFTPYRQNLYILLKTTKKNLELSNFKMPYNEMVNRKMALDRTNWAFLWSKKVDYYEYQLKHIKGKYTAVDESIEYFIGLAENAISYYNYNCKETNDKEVVTLCRRRIKEEDFYNPLNIILDFKERDIAEYLKYLFWNNKYKNINIETFLRRFNITKKGYKLLYCRMLYPCFYFDLYDNIINDREDENKIKSIINRTDEYEAYINAIYEAINTYSEIPRVEWIKK